MQNNRWCDILYRVLFICILNIYLSYIEEAKENGKLQRNEIRIHGLKEMEHLNEKLYINCRR